MENKVNLNKLSYVVFNARNALPDNSHTVLAVYNMWKELWSSTLLELDGSDKLFSDDFTRHQYVGALLHNEEPIGLCLFSEFDLEYPMWKEDSYFKIWPEETILKVSQEALNKKILVCCYFTIAKAWRKSTSEIDFKKVLAGLAVKYFINSDCSLMIATTRNNRGMDKVTYNLGAIPLIKDQVLHGVLVDLVLFKNEECRKIPNDLYVEKIWKNLKVLNPINNKSIKKAI
jgi:hypothetical protein